MDGNVDEAVLGDADRNMLELWTVLTRAAGGEVVVEGGATVMATPIPVSMFNPAFVLDPPADPAATLEAIAAFHADRGNGYAVYFRGATAPGLAEACTAAGLVEHWQPPLMVLDPIPASDPPPPEGLSIEVVGPTAGAGDEYLDTLCAGFGLPRPLVECLGGTAMAAMDGFTGLVGRVDGVAVAASGVYAQGATAGIYNVATAPDHRGRGIGAAITAAAARHAATTAGCTRAILQASEVGEPVYRRMGYATPARYRQFEG